MRTGPRRCAGNEGDSIPINISLSAASGKTVSVFVNTANGTATAGTDYVASLVTSVVFSPGETLKTVSITVNGDLNIEPDETFFVNLSGKTNAAIARSQGVGTIVNDDPSIQFSSASYSVAENAGSATITITRTDGTGTATVLVATSHGTANSADYTSVAQTVTNFTDFCSWLQCDNVTSPTKNYPLKAYCHPPAPSAPLN